MGGARVGEGCRSNPSHHGLPCEVRGRAGAVEVGRAGAERGRGCRERSGRWRRWGAREKVGSLTASGVRRERPTYFHLCALVFILRTISKGGS